MSEKSKFALYLTPETREKLDRWYTADGSRSKTEFIETAINFYIDSLAMKGHGALLPAAVSSAIDGQLGVFENRITSLLFKLAVEMAMMMHVVADISEIDDGYLERLHGKCVSEVKRANGQISFAAVVKSAELV